ncbi:MAG: hypothetical protein F4Y04_04770 [Chloroflexi bacterium]|nr:hypothetical protein [Chloroflexota bacterium]
MALTIEILPDPAANDLRLTQLAGERSSPLDRLNLLHGSALQRLSTQRMLAEASGGALAAVYGFTPVDLAQAALQLGEARERRTWPSGADLATLRRVLGTLSLEKLNPDAPGVASALLRTLTDLREAALSPDDLPEGDLRRIHSAWLETVSSWADRTSRYEDAIDAATPDSAFREALGDAPLIVSGIYDLTRIQRLLLARLSAAVDVRMLLVASSDDAASPAQRTLSALRNELNPRVIRSLIPAAAPAEERYFSTGDPTAEADEIASRVLQLGGQRVAFHRIAVLHQQGAPADERICAALERAEVPSWRIGGRRLSQAPVGHAALGLAGILLDPEHVERSGLLDWISHRSLCERPLGQTRRPAGWERAALDAGLTQGLHQMEQRLLAWRGSTGTSEAGELAEPLGELLGDLCQRSRELEECGSWGAAADALVGAYETYFSKPSLPGDDDLFEAARDSFDQLRGHDAIGAEWSPNDGLTALNRAFGSRVVRDPRRLIGGVNVGAASGPARGIRYEALFVAGAAERVFPAVGRQDPLLTDDERTAINARIPNALALQRERSDSDRHAWALARGAAVRQFTASWSRRSSAVGGPARSSSLILESAAGSVGLEPESALVERGRIERIDTALVTRRPGQEQVEAEDWSGVVGVPDERSLDLALLTAPGVDISALLGQIRPETEAADRARRERNAPRFSEYDGLLDADGIADDWRPLERIWTASALETYVTCPYRFYLQQIIGVQGSTEPAGPDRGQLLNRGRLMRRILASWVREYEHFKEDRTWFEYSDSPGYLNTVARRILDSAEGSGLLGPPAGASATRNGILRDLDRARRREASEARDGWRPLEVNAAFDDAPIRVSKNRTLRLRGMIDRIDVHASGRQRALSLFTGRTVPEVRGFVNGSSFLSVAELTALSQRGVAIREAEVEHRSVSSRGKFESQTLQGESLMSSGGASARSDGERLRDTLALIADRLEAANFIPYPGTPLRERPNCRRCPYESVCTVDVGRRYEHKARQHQDAVRDLEILRRQRV